MQEKSMKEIFENLTEENKNIITLMAKGMEIAQNTSEKVVK